MIINKVRGAVYERFKSISTLADKIGWHRQTLTLYVNGEREPDLSQIQIMANAMDMDVTELTEFFLHLKSQKCDR